MSPRPSFCLRRFFLLPLQEEEIVSRHTRHFVLFQQKQRSVSRTPVELSQCRDLCVPHKSVIGRSGPRESEPNFLQFSTEEVSPLFVFFGHLCVELSRCPVQQSLAPDLNRGGALHDHLIVHCSDGACDSGRGYHPPATPPSGTPSLRDRIQNEVQSLHLLNLLFREPSFRGEDGLRVPTNKEVSQLGTPLLVSLKNHMLIDVVSKEVAVVLDAETAKNPQFGDSEHFPRGVVRVTQNHGSALLHLRCDICKIHRPFTVYLSETGEQRTEVEDPRLRRVQFMERLHHKDAVSGDKQSPENGCHGLSGTQRDCDLRLWVNPRTPPLAGVEPLIIARNSLPHDWPSHRHGILGVHIDWVGGDNRLEKGREGEVLWVLPLSAGDCLE
mmetsp:Transcript_42620/g.84058  ORF Transcript_42620/g.84058 Transcript_42620/m.84058 type:complete len:384 (+) Transcript_42620:170-1321(+)